MSKKISDGVVHPLPTDLRKALSAKDEEGSVFEDVEAAASKARESARDWATQIIRSGQKINGQLIEMRDEQGNVRLSLPLKLVLS